MNTTYNLPYAKRNLSKLIDEVLGGASVTIAVDGKPVVDLVRHQPQGKFVLAPPGSLTLKTSKPPLDSSIDAT
jgi:antitoxin (DNA-binding transcriptional repressor) of toxin-antitoxin stability system